MDRILRSCVAFSSGVFATYGWIYHKAGSDIGFMLALIALSAFLVSVSDIFGEQNANKQKQ